MTGYAIIKLGGKQYVVREGEKLLVDRLDLDENKTFKPDVIFEGGDGKAELSPKGQPVTAKVLAHVQGKKIRIGKYRRRTGYRRHTGHRSKLTQIQIESIGAKTGTRGTAATKSATEKGTSATKPKASARNRTTKAKENA
jgi:large subunit ribosomal protein L21